MRSLDIVIVSFNGRDDLAACLRSLHDAPPSIPHAMVVVDNAPRMAAPRWYARLPRGDPDPERREPGFARQHRGFRPAGRPGAAAQHDTIVPRRVDGLAAALEHVRAAAAVPTRRRSGRCRVVVRPMISPWNELRQKIISRLHVGASAPCAATWSGSRGHVSGRLGDWRLPARAEADAEAVGLLDERYFMYTEDVDFCAPSGPAGVGVFVPEVEVIHLRGAPGPPRRAPWPRPTAAASWRSTPSTIQAGSLVEDVPPAEGGAPTRPRNACAILRAPSAAIAPADSCAYRHRRKKAARLRIAPTWEPAARVGPLRPHLGYVLLCREQDTAVAPQLGENFRASWRRPPYSVAEQFVIPA